jgi:hypothetical protein
VAILGAVGTEEAISAEVQTDESAEVVAVQDIPAEDLAVMSVVHANACLVYVHVEAIARDADESYM